MESVKDLVGCVKRFYRDNNVDKFDEIKKEHLPTINYFLNYLIETKFGLTWDELIETNVTKLDGRFGDEFILTE